MHDISLWTGDVSQYIGGSDVLVNVSFSTFPTVNASNPENALADVRRLQD